MRTLALCLLIGLAAGAEINLDRVEAVTLEDGRTLYGIVGEDERRPDRYHQLLIVYQGKAMGGMRIRQDEVTARRALTPQERAEHRPPVQEVDITEALEPATGGRFAELEGQAAALRAERDQLKEALTSVNAELHAVEVALRKGKIEAAIKWAQQQQWQAIPLGPDDNKDTVIQINQRINRIAVELQSEEPDKLAIYRWLEFLVRAKPMEGSPLQMPEDLR